MRLLTHNMMMCVKRGCTSEHFPLRIEAARIEVRASDFSADVVRALVPKLEWAALVAAAADCGQTVPAQPPTQQALEDPAFLKSLHDIILDVRLLLIFEFK